MTLLTSDGITLECAWNKAEDPLAVCVLCHPHPQHGGTMRAPLLDQITSRLVERHISVLRFNFRGVGDSSGSWGEGIGEVNDVAAAVESARYRHPDIPSILAGWSFGAAVSLGWLGQSQSDISFVGIAPPVDEKLFDGLPNELPPASRLIVIGDRDQFTSVEATTQYATLIDAQVEVLSGTDHFFLLKGTRIADLIADQIL